MKQVKPGEAFDSAHSPILISKQRTRILDSIKKSRN